MSSNSLLSRFKLHKDRKRANPTAASQSSPSSSTSDKRSADTSNNPKPVTNAVDSSSCPAQQAPPDDPSSSSPSKRLWDEAYDGLKKDEPELLNAYENIISRGMEKDDSSPSGGRNDEKTIAQTDREHRRSQMERIVRAGLERTKRENDVKQTVGVGLQACLTLKDLVGSALSTVPQAALAWAGVCFVMQVSLPICLLGLC